ncbi:TetR family transcriptional regulator [bacterium]|nr:TetR family transcriptional regulator [bacterium]
MKMPDVPSALYYQIFNLKPGRGEERKLKIVEAAIESLATGGLENTTFDSIGKRLKMRRTHVAYYFTNRDELIQACIRYVVAVGQSAIIEDASRAASWKPRLKAVVEGPFDWLGGNPKFAAVMVLFYSLCSYSKNYRELQNNIRSMGEQRLASCLAGTSLSESQARDLARQMQMLMTGAFVLSFCSDYPVPVAKLKTQISKTCIDWVEKAIA